MRNKLIVIAPILLLIAAFSIPFFLRAPAPSDRGWEMIAAWAGMFAAAALSAYLQKYRTNKPT